MTKERLAHCLEVLGWSQRELAAKLDIDPKTVQRWARGARIDREVAVWLEGLVTAHMSLPAPEKVR